MKKFRKSLLIASLACAVSLSAGLMSACEEKSSVTYEFNTNGGQTISSVEVEEGTQYTLPIPTWEGYRFEGWYVNQDLSGEPVTAVTAETNQIYYAKWQKVYALSLELNGGTLSETTFYVDEGADVYAFLQNYVPTKVGYVFGAWFNGETELVENTCINADMSLSAKYKVAYTVELYLEKLDGSGYEKAAEDVIGYEYVGVNFTSEQRVTGFKEVQNDNTVTQKTISETASENVFKHYFDRNTYLVTFMPNYPNNAQGESIRHNVRYGSSIEVPSDLVYEGYYLAGWSTSSSGEVQYKANYINSVLFDKDDETETKADSFMPERHTSLYGVWVKGYSDMFGSDDTIFIVEDEAETAYLSRGGFFFKGTYNPTKKEFRFTDSELDSSIFGRLNDDGTYIYSSTARAESVHTLYEVGGGLVETTRIFFDYYNGITYSNEEGNSKGTYEVNGAYYEAKFTEGPLAGKTMTLIVNTVELDGTRTPIFQVRNEEEVAMGKLAHFYVDGGALAQDQGNALTFNGFGTATLGGESYSYTMDKDANTVTLRNSSDAELICKFITVGGAKGYIEYSASYDHQYEITVNESLTLDGAYLAKYTNGSTTIEGYYTLKESVFGGTIVKVETEQNAKYAFIITEKTETLPDSTEQSTYSAVKKDGGYAEYYYMDGVDKIYYAPMLVLNEPQAGKATLYGYTNSQTFEKVSLGSYSLNAETGLYLYETETIFDAPNASAALDLTNVKSFVFSLDDEIMTLSVNYWHSWTAQDGTSTSLYKEYKSDLGGELRLVGGFAFYKDKGYVLTGVYTTDENGVTTISTPRGGVWVEIYESTGKFLTLEGRPYKSYQLKADGNVNRAHYLAFNMKGGATYTELTFNAKGEEVSRKEYKGTIEKLDERIPAGAEIYQFTSPEYTFKYLPLSDGSNSYFASYNETYNGTYNGANSTTLSLDGYGYTASYRDGDGNKQEGRYSVADGVIVVNFNDGVRYFDINGREFTLRGKEYGTYAVLENQIANGLFLTLDGYNKLTVFKYEDVEDEDSRVDIDTAGTYVFEGDRLTLTYKDGGRDVTIEGVCNFSDGTFIVRNKEATQTFVNANDWSILILDDFGNATKYSADGKKEVGTYMLITDTMLYFANEAGDDACIYVYDRAESTATPIKFTARSYYTEDLEALLFTEYGFAIFNGTTRYYYNVVNDKVIMYRQAEPGETGNKYGFIVDESIGEFGDTETYGGKTYQANSGYAITFNRKEESKAHYPVLVAENTSLPLEALTFTPSGEAEFTVVGNVRLDGKNYGCQVTREINEDGGVEMYVLIGAGMGNYRFDISVKYTGSNFDGENNNEYEVTGMTWNVASYSYAYLDTYYNYFLNDYYYGTSLSSSYKNDKGFITLNRVYNKEGEEVKDKHYITGTFFEGSAMYCLDGSIASFDKALLDESMVEENGVYTATFTAQDGYVYHIYFTLKYHSAFGLYGYTLEAFTREETLEANDGYTVVVERRIASDKAFNAKMNYKETLKKGEEVIVLNDFGSWALLGENSDILYYIDAVMDADGNTLSSTYYNITYTSNTSGSVDQDSKVPAVYETATVFIETSKVYYAEGDMGTYAEILPTLGITLFSYQGSFGLATGCQYYEETGAYVLVCIGNAYEVKIVGEYITMKLFDRYYSENKKSSAVIDDDYGVITFTYEYNAKMVKSYTYDETTGTYTVIDTTDTKYTIKIVGEYVEVKLIEE